MIKPQTKWLSLVAATVFPLASMSAVLVPVKETRLTHVEGSVELYDPSQLPDDAVVIASDSFSGSSSGYASASDGWRSASISADTGGGGTVSSDRITLETWNDLSYSHLGHFMSLGGQSINEYQLKFDLAQPSTVRLTGLIQSSTGYGISTDVEIEMAGRRLSFEDSQPFDTTLLLEAGRYSFAAFSSVGLSFSECCTDGEYGSTHVQLDAVFTAVSSPVPEPAPLKVGAVLTLFVLLNWRRRISPGL